MSTSKLFRVAVIDGQGGGIGKSLVERLQLDFENQLEIYALGTNTLATSEMRKAGATYSATGENAIVFNSSKMDIIMGSVGIISANSMHGELTPQMAIAISSSASYKILIPLNRCSIFIAGLNTGSISSYLDNAMDILRQIVEKGELCC